MNWFDGAFALYMLIDQAAMYWTYKRIGYAEDRIRLIEQVQRSLAHDFYDHARVSRETEH